MRRRAARTRPEGAATSAVVAANTCGAVSRTVSPIVGVSVLRRLVLLASALTLSAGAAVFAGEPAPATLERGAVVAHAAECGGQGFDKIVVASENIPYTCVHHDRDTYDAMAAGRAVASGTPAVGVTPVCYGDGTTGPRIQMVYGYVQGDPNRSKVAVPQVQAIAGKMEAIVRAASAGKDLGIRFAMTKGCKAVDVKVVAFPREALYNDKPGDDNTQFGHIAAHLDTLGMKRTDWKYNVLWDGWVDGGTCGLGELFGQDTQHPANYNNGLPTLGARTDSTAVTGTRPLLLPRLSVSWNHVFGKAGPSCWGAGKNDWPIAALHEMQHNIGAVQSSAPHSDGGAHCLDVPSVMCYGKDVVHVKQCDNKPVPVFDCGQDDYWNPNPPAGSYLDLHANLARSQYYGPQRADQLVASPL